MSCLWLSFKCLLLSLSSQHENVPIAAHGSLSPPSALRVSSTIGESERGSSECPTNQAFIQTTRSVLFSINRCETDEKSWNAWIQIRVWHLCRLLEHLERPQEIQVWRPMHHQPSRLHRAAHSGDSLDGNSWPDISLRESSRLPLQKKSNEIVLLRTPAEEQYALARQMWLHTSFLPVGSMTTNLIDLPALTAVSFVALARSGVCS